MAFRLSLASFLALALFDSFESEGQSLSSMAASSFASVRVSRGLHFFGNGIDMLMEEGDVAGAATDAFEEQPEELVEVVEVEEVLALEEVLVLDE